MRKLWPAIMALAAGVGFTLWAYPRLPAQVVIHWGVDGEPNGWAGPLEAAVLLPGLWILVAAIFAVVPSIDPHRESWELHSKTYWLIVNFVLCFLMLIHLLVIGNALGWHLPVERVIALGIGALFLLLGNVMPRLRPNWFVGIRTPWTLSDDGVWRQTHRIGGICLILAGVLIAATGMLGAGALPLAVGIAIAICVVIPIGYSWILWRRIQAPRSGAQQ